MYDSLKKNYLLKSKFIILACLINWNLMAESTALQNKFSNILNKIELHTQLLEANGKLPDISTNETNTAWNALQTDINDLSVFIKKAQQQSLTLNEKIFIESRLNESLTTLSVDSFPEIIIYFVNLYKFWETFCRSQLMESLILESGKKSKDYYLGCLTKVESNIKQALKEALKKDYLLMSSAMLEYLFPIFNQKTKINSSLDSELLIIFLEQTDLFLSNFLGKKEIAMPALKKVLLNLEKINADPPTKNKIKNIINDWMATK